MRLATGMTHRVSCRLERFQKALPKCKVTGVQWKRLKENQERNKFANDHKQFVGASKVRLFKYLEN